MLKSRVVQCEKLGGGDQKLSRVKWDETRLNDSRFKRPYALQSMHGKQRAKSCSSRKSALPFDDGLD